MTAIASGFNYSNEPICGIAYDICWTINLIKFPEYPLPPFSLGTTSIGKDNSIFVFVTPVTSYNIGTVGYIDSNWNFTAITTTNSLTAVGYPTAVMSQVASVVGSPTSLNYDGVWVQTKGLCPAINVAANTTANVSLYTSSVAGQLTSTPGGQLVGNTVIFTTTTASGNQPGFLS